MNREPSDSKPLDPVNLDGVWEAFRQAMRELIMMERYTENAEIYTYRSISDNKYHRSPFVYIDPLESDEILVQISGNVVCDPPLTTADMASLVLLGWSSPNVSAEEYLDEDGFAGMANVWRKYPNIKSVDLMARDIVIALRDVYLLAEGDLVYMSRSKQFVDHLDSLNLLKRLDASEKNENRNLFKLEMAEQLEYWEEWEDD